MYGELDRDTNNNLFCSNANTEGKIMTTVGSVLAVNVCCRDSTYSAHGDGHSLKNKPIRILFQLKIGQKSY